MRSPISGAEKTMQIRIDAPQTSEIPALRALWKEAFGDGDTYLDTFFGVAFSTDRCRRLTVDGALAAALYIFDCTCRGAKIAYLYAVATAEAYRGRGLCRALMEDTHRHLAIRGYAGAILVPATDALFGFYGRMGYRPATAVREIAVSEEETLSEEKMVSAKNAPTGPAPTVTRIDGETYGARRADLLPAGGVLQEGATLAFLETQYALYAGENFLLAASEEDGALYGSEFLGDPALLPQIVHALGYPAGTFRTVGEERPLSMYLPFTEDAPNPAYFGLPLD